MSQSKKYKENLARLKCTKCGRINYYTRRNKKTSDKLELKKHCRWDREHTIHKEIKK